MHNRNRFKLGLFGPNCSSGVIRTTVPERWPADWHENVELAQLADAHGIDFLLPVARWKGYGGATDFEGTSWETISWAATLLALTERITIFGTVHTPLFDPVIAAKQMVTADHAGRGRFGLNVVCGWNSDEFAMFGREQREHAERYDHGQEWLDAVRLMWESHEEFDFAGRFFQLKGVRAKPKPYGGSRPVIMNAGRSPAGQAFAMRNCDAFFTGVRAISFDESTGRVVPNVAEAAAQVARVQQQAAEMGREMAVFTRGEVVCRRTQAEAREYFHYAFEEHADWDGVDRQIFMQTGLVAGDAGFAAQRTGHVRRFPIVGDPDAVAGLLAQLSGSGFSGIALGFINYLDELPYFSTEVLPRLLRLGLREP